MANKIKEKIKSMRSQEEIKDILLEPKADRRLLSYVPDETGQRQKTDRRGDTNQPKHGTDKAKKKNVAKVSNSLPEHEGIRYLAELNVEVTCWTSSGKKLHFACKSVDISTTGMLLSLTTPEQRIAMEDAKRLKLKFEIEAGTMPEGYESKVNIKAQVVRVFENAEGIIMCGVLFEPSLAAYIHKRRGSNLRVVSIVFLALLVLITVLLRTESFLYFRFNRIIYLYSMATAFFLLSRYFFGALYKPVPINPEFTPGVTIIIPCFNEEEWIQRTILSCINQDYPADKLEVIIVDDCSNDKSMEKIAEIVERLKSEEDRYNVKERISYTQMEQNAGKRDALSKGVLMAQHDLIVFVDSDSFLDPEAIRNLVQPFQDPKMGGVTGRTDVANTYTNGLTKMQSVRYYVAFRVMKAAEAYFDAVTCLSGPLSCYKKSIIIENMDAWLNQSFLGQKATFGDDRAMTNFVLRKHRTAYQDTAICSTIVPNSHKQFLKQQMRWKRSWLRESSIAASFIWKKEPMMALFFYMGYIIPMIAPIIVTYNLIIVPITQRVFPLTFIIGLLVMSMLMSMAQLFFRRSSTWIYGMWFCLYYVLVLMWQMPYAWVTFWKSTWGTRMTPADIKAAAKKEQKRQKKEERAKRKSGKAGS